MLSCHHHYNGAGFSLDVNGLHYEVHGKGHSRHARNMLSAIVTNSVVAVASV